MSIHPFDQAMALRPGPASSPDLYTGSTSEAYWNMIGPFGGATAATVLQAVMRHPARIGDPVALTVNYAAALEAGEFSVRAIPARTNRSTQHWQITLSQKDAAGLDSVVITATALTAVRRQTWSQNDTPMPEVPAPEDTPASTLFVGVSWVSRYEIRILRGAVPEVFDGRSSDSLTQLWLRERPERPLDFLALTAMADAFYPRVWLRRAHRVPAGTVTITIYFHAGSAELLANGCDFLLGQAQAQAFRNGFFDQSAQLWSRTGVLLATTQQLVYFKE
jgi:acyl-CoA thioesterase